MLFPNIVDAKVKFCAEEDSPTYLATPGINSALVDNELSRAKSYQALRFRQLYGHFPKNMRLQVKFNFKSYKGNATIYHYF